MIKLLNSYYDEVTGCSKVEIATECGIFTGYAWLHPDDKKVESHFVGCEIAEYRATIQYLKRKSKFLSYRLLALEDLRKDFIVRGCELDSEEMRILNTRLEQMYRQKKEYKNNIKSLKDVINNKVENRLLIIDRMNKIKEKKNEEEKDSE